MTAPVPPTDSLTELLAIKQTIASAAGVYDCPEPCGGYFELFDDSTIEEYAALNRWLGHHNRCSHVSDAPGTSPGPAPVVASAGPAAPNPPDKGAAGHPVWKTSELLDGAADRLDWYRLGRDLPYLQSFVAELRDRAACFKAHGD